MRCVALVSPTVVVRCPGGVRTYADCEPAPPVNRRRGKTTSEHASCRPGERRERSPRVYTRRHRLARNVPPLAHACLLRGAHDLLGGNGETGNP
ncbi:hypothetical protein K466DRAFT_405596 [Polyporus arcularius HHB13444]|uniref:Uncharacterized protein n=1 Tax=Polyporus arcularius HHB13444 TaxID=1314778 RepID=A0A5C3PLB5_9APHY|nr:hypothetical protein K466DRAFT_405596 [Polyporus arcularius HHB13444]